MKRKIFILGAIAVLTVLLTALCACGEKIPEEYVRDWREDMPYSDKDYTVIQTGEEIRILQLTAIHYDSSNDRKEDTIKLLKDTIERADADLITVTGDWCYMSLSKKKKCREVFATIDSYGIPWAPIFGNHDAEFFVSKFDYADIFKEYGNCLFDSGYSNLGGVGNYTVVFKNGEKIVGAAVMVDTRSSVRMFSSEYQSLTREQIKWYRWTVDGLNALYKQSGGEEETVPTLLYTHIPVNEYVDAYEKGNVISGENKEKCCVPEENTGMFDAILEKGSTKAIFCGHDHANNSESLYKGVKFVYGVQSGWCKNYADDRPKGRTVAVFDGKDVKIERIIYGKEG